MSTNAFDDARRSAVYDVIRERRDIRSTFTMDPIDDAALTRVLAAAHMAPSVGFSQPWDFVLVRDEERRRRIQRLAQRQRRPPAEHRPRLRTVEPQQPGLVRHGTGKRDRRGGVSAPGGAHPIHDP